MCALDTHEEMFVCEHCGHATSVAADECPNCGEAMPKTHPHDKKASSDDDVDLDEELLTDGEIAAGQDDGTMSLEALRDEEDDDSDSNYNANNDDY